MSKILVIMKYELLQFFSTLSGYIFITVFVLINTWFFTMQLFVYNVANMSSFFTTSQLLLLIFVPIITMNLISKEKQSGTIETIYTLPLKLVEFILGKYFTSLILITISFIPSLVHFITICIIGINVDFGIIFCGFLSLVLTSATYCAIGIFTGCITTNQITSFILSFLIIIIFYLLENVLLFLPVKLTSLLQFMSITWQNANLIKGVIDTRVLTYFSSIIFIFLWWGISYLESKKR